MNDKDKQQVSGTFHGLMSAYSVIVKITTVKISYREALTER